MPVAVFSQRIALGSLPQVKSPARTALPYFSVSFAPIIVSPAQVNAAFSALNTETPPAQSSSQSAGAGGGCQLLFTMSQRAPSLSTRQPMFPDGDTNSASVTVTVDWVGASPRPAFAGVEGVSRGLVHAPSASTTRTAAQPRPKAISTPEPQRRNDRGVEQGR